MRLLPRLWVFALLVFPVVGCTQVTDEVRLAFVVEGVVGGVEFGPGLEGVQVCVTDTGYCVTTEATGEGILFLPPTSGWRGRRLNSKARRTCSSTPVSMASPTRTSKKRRLWVGEASPRSCLVSFKSSSVELPSTAFQ